MYVLSDMYVLYECMYVRIYHTGVEDENDAYYHLLMTRVDETLEETKREKERRESEVEIRNYPTGDDEHGDDDDTVA